MPYFVFTFEFIFTSPSWKKILVFDEYTGQLVICHKHNDKKMHIDI